MSNTNNSEGSLLFTGRSPFLNLCMNIGLIAASTLAGWVWTAVIGTAGDTVWFFMAVFCGVLFGIAVHQLMTKGRWLLTLFCLAAFVGSTMAAHALGLSKQQPMATKTREPLLVKAEKIQPQPFSEQFTFSGVIEPERSAFLAFSAGGLIQALYVDENDRVQKDQKIAQLNTDQLMAGLEEAKAVSARTESNRRRLEKLVAENAASEMLRDDAIAEDRVAKARVKAIQANIAYMTLKAPFAGQIAIRFVEEGEYASPGKPMFKLLVTDPVKAAVGVPERMIGLIQKDAPTAVTIDAMDAQKTFKGHVTFVSLETVADSPLYTVEITVPNEAGKLKPGMAVRTSIQGRRYEKTTHLKTSWVQRTGGQHVIFQLVPLEEARDEFLTANSMSPEQLQDMVAMLANPADIGFARKVELKAFFMRDGQYVVCDQLPDYPIVTHGAYLLKDFAIVRTGILKNSGGRE